MRQVPGRFQIPPGLCFCDRFRIQHVLRSCEAEMINRARYVIQMSGYVIVFF